MSKVGQWVLGMQEDATWMTLAEFIEAHGERQQDIWHQVNGPDDYDWEPEPNIPEDLPCEKIF